MFEEVVDVTFTGTESVAIAGGIGEGLGVGRVFDHFELDGVWAGSLWNDGDFGRIVFVGNGWKIDIPKVASGEAEAL